MYQTTFTKNLSKRFAVWQVYATVEGREQVIAEFAFPCKGAAEACAKSVRGWVTFAKV